MWHGDIQSLIIKYRSSKHKHFREFTCPEPPVDVVVDPCVNRFIEQFCKTNNKVWVIIDINAAIQELYAFKTYLESITTDERKDTRPPSLVSEEMEDSD